MTEAIEDLRRNIRECIDTDRERAKWLLGMLADELESNMKWMGTNRNAFFLTAARNSVENDRVIGAAYLIGALSVMEYSQRICR
jgi:hypothetical protein